MIGVLARLGDVFWWCSLLLTAALDWTAFMDPARPPWLSAMWFSWWWNHPLFWIGLIIIGIGAALRYILRGPA
jgi:hypothetical protein